MKTIQCMRCGEENPQLEKPPFRSDLGERIQARVCQSCWQEWLKHQTLLINHYGLDPRDKRAREFLYQQVETVLLEGGEGEHIDTSEEGTIEW